MIEERAEKIDLEWFERPSLWLAEVERARIEWSETREARWSWTALHHQILTLCTQSEHDPNVPALWFRSGSDKQGIYGVVLTLSDDEKKLCLVDSPSLRDMSQVTGVIRRVLPDSIMGDSKFVEAVAPLIKAARIVDRQLAWRKGLTTAASDPKTPLVVIRRAQESDRKHIEPWARQFALENDLNDSDTVKEAMEWRRRGKLLIFTHPDRGTPLGMAALSGDWIEPNTEDRSIRMSLLLIAPEYRGLGYGRASMQALEIEAQHERAGSIVLFSSEANPKARRFYASIGYDLCGEWCEATTR